MSDSPLIQQEIALLHDLEQLVAERAKAEARTESARAAGSETAQREFQEASRAVTQRYEAETAATEREALDRRRSLAAQADAEHAATTKEYQALRQKIAARRQAEQEAADKQQEDARWEAGTMFDAAKADAKAEHEGVRKQLAEDRETIAAIRADALAFLEGSRQGRVAAETPAAEPPAA